MKYLENALMKVTDENRQVCVYTLLSFEQPVPVIIQCVF